MFLFSSLSIVLSLCNMFCMRYFLIQELTVGSGGLSGKVTSQLQSSFSIVHFGLEKCRKKQEVKKRCL